MAVAFDTSRYPAVFSSENSSRLAAATPSDLESRAGPFLPTTLLVGILDRRRVQARVCGDPLNILQEKRTASHRMAMTRNTSLRRME